MENQNYVCMLEVMFRIVLGSVPAVAGRAGVPSSTAPVTHNHQWTSSPAVACRINSKWLHFLDALVHVPWFDRFLFDLVCRIDLRFCLRNWTPYHFVASTFRLMLFRLSVSSVTFSGIPLITASRPNLTLDCPRQERHRLQSASSNENTSTVNCLKWDLMVTFWQVHCCVVQLTAWQAKKWK